jgi:hypothetical protein
LGRAEIAYMDLALDGKIYRPIRAANVSPWLLYLRTANVFFAEMLDNLNILRGAFPKIQIIEVRTLNYSAEKLRISEYHLLKVHVYFDI